jgi:hypothetical protein
MLPQILVDVKSPDEPPWSIKPLLEWKGPYLFRRSKCINDQMLGIMDRNNRDRHDPCHNLAYSSTSSSDANQSNLRHDRSYPGTYEVFDDFLGRIGFLATLEEIQDLWNIIS